MTTEDAARGSPAGRAAQLAARARETALCLDFDGTLSPIVTTRRLPGHWPAWSSCSDRWPPGSRPWRWSRAARPTTWPSPPRVGRALSGAVRAPGDPRRPSMGRSPPGGGRPAVVAAQKDLRDSPPSATAVPGRRTSNTRWPSTAGGSPIPSAGPCRSTRQPASWPTGTDSRSCWASWSGSCARPCLATRATPPGGWSLSRAGTVALSDHPVRLPPLHRSRRQIMARSSGSTLSRRPSMKESLHVAGLPRRIPAQCNSAACANACKTNRPPSRPATAKPS
jgi:hypothetical protein